MMAAERDEFLTLGRQLPGLWQRSDVSWADKKSLVRSLIDKVVLHRMARDRIATRVSASTRSACPLPRP
jgi:hypothetical protein